MPSNIEQESSPTQSSELSFNDWIKGQIDAERYWFQKIALPDQGIVTPGWSDPATEKLPHYGIPDDLTGMRVLDIGCAEGFFSFEAERRGAAEVVSVDSFPDSVRRFNICRAGLGSKATAYLCNVYDLSPQTFGTFDLVLFYGVLYHLRHPILALQKIRQVCTGTMLLQTAVHEEPGLEEVAVSRFHPRGMQSGPADNPTFDPTVFFRPNRECVRAFVDHSGFVDVETICENDFVSIVVRAKSPVQAKGEAPDQLSAPWS